MHTATEVEIDDFLNDCRRTILNSFYLSNKREENRKTICTLGLTKNNIRDEIISLTTENYSSGPLKDHNSTDEIWIFGKEINGKEVYIKLELSKYNDPGDLIRTLFCVSFHFSKYSIDYPYKK